MVEVDLALIVLPEMRAASSRTVSTRSATHPLPSLSPQQPMVNTQQVWAAGLRSALHPMSQGLPSDDDDSDNDGPVLEANLGADEGDDDDRSIFESEREIKVRC